LFEKYSFRPSISTKKTHQRVLKFLTSKSKKEQREREKKKEKKHQRTKTTQHLHRFKQQKTNKAKLVGGFNEPI